MSFENSQVSYVHLVSYPSCWLPPKHTKKLLIVGLEQPDLEMCVTDIQNLYPEMSFALYFVPSFSSSDLEQLDWLLINQQHMHGTWLQVTDWDTLALALAFKDSVSAHCQSSPSEIIKLMENCNLQQQTFVEFVGAVCNKEAKQA